VVFMMLAGAMKGIAGDLFFQMVVQGKRSGCVDGTELAMAGIMGALTGGLGAPTAKALPAASRTARLTQEGVEHIALRHFPTSGTTGAGKFAMTSLREVRSLIIEAIEKGAARANTRGRPGSIFEYDFGRQIGTNVAGAPATKLRVVITPDSIVKTAFPF
jgi:hypothetical protein